MLVTIAATATRGSDTGVAAATVHGYNVALVICAGACVAAALIGVLLPTPAKLSADLASASAGGAA